MNIKPFLTPALRREIFREWTPDRGLPAGAILELFALAQVTPDQIAQDLGETPNRVHQVISRNVRYRKIEESISLAFAGLGLTYDAIWGIVPPLHFEVRCLPEGFSEIPLYNGPIGMDQHIMLLADCETSGPDAERHRLVEIALLKVAIGPRDGGGICMLGALDGYIGLQDPGPHPVNPISMRIHGIPKEVLLGKALDMPRIMQVVHGAEAVIAHNVSFDRRFCTKSIPGLLSLSWVCSYLGVPWKALGFKDAKLKTIAKDLGLRPPTHRASSDVVALYTALNHLLAGGRSGIDYLLRR
jgi:DNA polymerase-3 subunit epsilon